MRKPNSVIALEVWSWDKKGSGVPQQDLTSSASAAGLEPLSSEPAPRRRYAIGLMIGSSLAISFGGLIMRSIEGADAWQINIYRSISLVFAVLLILLYQYRGRTLQTVKKIGRPGLVGGIFLSLAGLAFLQALTHTTVANTLFTLSAIPFLTAAMGWLFLKESLNRATLITMCIAAFGIFVMVADEISAGSLFGNAMALVTALGFSAYAVIVRRYRQIDMLPTLLVGSLIVFTVAFAVRFQDLGITLHDLLLCFLWGGILSGIANWLFIVASRHLVAAEVTFFMLLEFALGPLWVWLFIGETPTHWTLIGGVLVIAAVALRAYLELQRSGRPLRRGRMQGPW